jgi:alpha-tubulin suppressor-like RCC1 family protein
MFAVGYNEYGQLGRGFSCEGRQEARIVDKFVKFLDEPPEDVQISQIACGDNHTAAVSVTGDL